MRTISGSISLREMLTSDLRTVAAAEKKAFPEDPWRLKDFSELVAMPSGMGLVAEVKETLVGYLIGQQAADEADLLNMGVIPEARRQGVARGLLRHWLERIAERGAATAWLDVRVSNRPAILLYESFGFIVAGVRPAYYSDGEDALMMRLTPVAKGLNTARDRDTDS